MLINLTNHPYSDWSNPQLEAAGKWGDIIDLPFPVIDASGDEKYILSLVNEYSEVIKKISEDNHVSVHVMGELTFTFAMVSKLQKEGISCIASTTKRTVTQIVPGKKQVEFKFVRFRPYTLL